MRAHPAEGKLQAMLDGELPIARALAVRLHVWRCEVCHERMAATVETSALVAALIGRSTRDIDRESAWDQLVVKSGGRAVSQRRAMPPWTSATALVLAAALVLVALSRGKSSPATGEELFALVHEAQAHPASSRLRDDCCGDHDGGDQADDGLLTLSRPGEKVTVVIVYEDVDHSGTFTKGDIVRYVSTIPRVPNTSTER